MPLRSESSAWARSASSYATASMAARLGGNSGRHCDRKIVLGADLSDVRKQLGTRRCAALGRAVSWTSADPRILCVRVSAAIIRLLARHKNYDQAFYVRGRRLRVVLVRPVPDTGGMFDA